MSVTIRPYRNGGIEVDIRVELPDGSEHGLRCKAPVSSRSAAQRWGEDRERLWYHELTHPTAEQPEVPTLREFWPRFLEGHARANRQKASGIFAKENIARLYLLPKFGEYSLDAVCTEAVQRLKAELSGRPPKTINNILTVLNTVLRKAVEWGVIDKMPCTVRLLPVSSKPAAFHDFEEFEALVKAAQARSAVAYAVVLLGGEAGLRRGEIAALQWQDVNVQKRQLCVQRAVWKAHIDRTKGGRLRYVPMTARVAAALRAIRHVRGPFVFGTTEPASENTVADYVRQSAVAAGLKHTGIHILRHTFCSHLAMRGAPARAIQELAGHSDLRTTLRTCTSARRRWTARSGCSNRRPVETLWRRRIGDQRTDCRRAVLPER